MGLHIAWDGPQIYIQMVAMAVIAYGVIWLVRRA